MACRLAGKTTLALLVLTMMSCVGFGQDAISDLKKEIETLKQGQQLILQQLQLLLQRSPTPSTAERSVRGMEFEIPDNPVRGSKSAKLMLVDFTDYQCPFCGRYARETFPQILKEYVDTGKIPVGSPLTGCNRYRRKCRVSGRATALLFSFTFRRNRLLINKVTLAMTRCPARSLRT